VTNGIKSQDQTLMYRLYKELYDFGRIKRNREVDWSLRRRCTVELSGIRQKKSYSGGFNTKKLSIWSVEICHRHMI